MLEGKGMKYRRPINDRFMENVSPEPNSGCWLWLGTCIQSGYGTLRFSGRSTYAHRVAYELFKGPVPEGLELDHLCRVRCCVNPQHLEAVTHHENILRGNIGKHNRRKTNCPLGHPYDELKTYASGKKMRRCRECGRLRAAQKRRETR